MESSRSSSRSAQMPSEPAPKRHKADTAAASSPENHTTLIASSTQSDTKVPVASVDSPSSKITDDKKRKRKINNGQTRRYHILIYYVLS